MEQERCSGILLHPTSLPGNFGIGSFGCEAFEFVDNLKLAGQKLWQILPLNHIAEDGNSPYKCYSAFAGNPLLIDLEKLVECELLTDHDLQTTISFDSNKVDYEKVRAFKIPLLKTAYKNFISGKGAKIQKYYTQFCAKEKRWLDDYTLFISLHQHLGAHSWVDWPFELRYRKESVLSEYRQKLKKEIEFHKFIQFVFFWQWHELKDYANKNKIKIIGDIPIYVSYDSADTWVNPELFYLNKELKPTVVAGVPPDYFSEDGQLWGNPVYDWQRLKETDYNWWLERLKFSLEQADIVRLDHFRAFHKYWAVPATDKTARRGSWEKGPGTHFFSTMISGLGELPLIAEDLGIITKGVTSLRSYFDFPGMKVLQFAFDSCKDNEHLPHNYVPNSVVYTGTHDNNTTLGWYRDLDESSKKYLKKYLNMIKEDVSWSIIRAAWASVSVIAVAPLQDLLNLGEEGRMNTPGIAHDNWEWRYEKKMLTGRILKKIKKLTKIYARS